MFIKLTGAQTGQVFHVNPEFIVCFCERDEDTLVSLSSPDTTALPVKEKPGEIEKMIEEATVSCANSRFVGADERG